MRNSVGFDLNGAWDFACEDSDDELDILTKDLGIHGSLIRLSGESGRWVGGSQTGIAPHGRGNGWGKIGAEENRLFIAAILESLSAGVVSPVHVSALEHLLSDVAPDAGSTVFAIPDTPSFDERAQETFLSVLRKSSRARPTLLWRPIATILGWLNTLPSDFELRDGMRVGIISLMKSGVHISNVKLVREELKSGLVIWVPERDAVGIELTGSFAGDCLVQQYWANLIIALGEDVSLTLDGMSAPWRSAVGQRSEFELARLANRSWKRLPLFVAGKSEINVADSSASAVERLLGADLLLLEGPFSSNESWTKAVLNALFPRLLQTPSFRIKNDTVSSGCLIAARRNNAGLPVYYDFLPQLEINAIVQGEPRFVELIPKGERLPGGTIYKRHAPGDFAIGRRATKLSFYLFKEGFSEGRRSEIDLPEEAQDQHRITLSVEQVPGQGYAKVRIESDTFVPLRHQPLELDWSRMTSVGESRDEILDHLARKSGLSYPNAAIFPGHPLHWHANHRSGNLVAQLESYCQRPLIQEGRINDDARIALQVLRDRFRRAENPAYVARLMGLACTDVGAFRALNSDGTLPEARGELRVSAEADVVLNRALGKAANELSQLLSIFKANADAGVMGDLVGFSSWCFWRCPETVISVLLETYRGELGYPIQQNLMREAAGRVIHERHQLEHYFGTISANLSEAGSLTSPEFSALGRVLGSNAEAAAQLPPRAADRILQETCEHLSEENRKGRADAYKRKFKLALLMLAALMRHRSVRPNFLDPSGIAGQNLLAMLIESEQRIERFAATERRHAERIGGKKRAAHISAARRLDQNSAIVGELVSLINEQGNDPNIIRKIEEMNDMDD